MKPALWVIVAAVATLLALPVVSPIERRAFDSRLSLRRDDGWPKDLVLVPVNDESINLLGRWPWPRSRTAEVLEILRKEGVKTVLLDIAFTGETTPQEDQALAAVLGDSVLAIGFATQGAEAADMRALEKVATAAAPPEAPWPAKRFLTALPQFHAASRGAGHALAPPSQIVDGIVRTHYPIASLGERGLPSLALASWLSHRGLSIADVRIEGNTLLLPEGRSLPLAGGEFAMDLVPGGRPPQMIATHELLEGRRPKFPLKDAMAVVYVDSVFTHDEHPSPLGPRTAGGLLHAYSVRTLDNGRVPRAVPAYIPLLACFVLVMASLRFMDRQPPMQVASFGVVASGAYVLLAVLLVPLTDVFLPVAWPPLLLLLSTVLVALQNGRVADAERMRLRRLLDQAKSRQLPTMPEPSTSAPTKLGPAGAAPAGGDRATLPARPPRPLEDVRASTGSRGSVDSTPLLAASDELDEPVEVGRYLVQRSLGRGGMGAIFLAIDQELARPVALKVLHAATDTGAYRRFRREALAVARLSHPNVVQIYEVGFDAAVPYIVMEYVAGGTCSDMLRDPDAPYPLPWERTSRIVEGVAKGLGAAHAMGIVHRDVKPANLLLVHRDGTESKVADFGIAKLGGGETLTREGSFVGTIGYLSPEQARGKDVDARSDVYSLGITWYKLLTGVAPYDGTTAEILGAQQHADIPDPRKLNPAVPQPLVDVLFKMTARNREERYADGNIAAAAIAAVLTPAGAAASSARRA